MRLSQLLEYPCVSLQCHNVPDADALASAFGIFEYLREHGKKADLFYSGPKPVSKPDILEMIHLLEIPVRHVPQPGPVEGLLVMVDCQYDGGNVTVVAADAVCVIDHHNITTALPELSDVRPNLASCSTLVWDLLNREGFEIDQRLLTALHYGLYVDSSGFERMTHPLDRDLRDAGGLHGHILSTLKNSVLSLNDLSLTSACFGSCIHYPDERFLVLPAPPCEPNLLGIIGDLAMRVHGVDLVLSFSENTLETNFSIRSSSRALKAGDVANACAGNIGRGGGDNTRAGGRLPVEHFSAPGAHQAAAEYFAACVREHVRSYSVVDCTDIEAPERYFQDAPNVEFADFSQLGRYEKRDAILAYVPGAEILPEGGKVFVRMLEGDIYAALDAESCLMIGIEGEIYPISSQTFAETYTPLDDRAPVWDMEYSPVVKCAEKGIDIPLAGLARSCFSRGGSRIRAVQLRHGLKLFTRWDAENYVLGEPGDWLALRETNPPDWYIIKRSIFPQLYAAIK